MNDYAFKTNEGKTIEFSGELIGSVENSGEFGDGIVRTFSLKTYSTKPGYVAQIDYMSERAGENAGTIIEKVDSLNDVQNFFFVFDSHEVLQREKGLSRDEATERTRLANKLNAIYEKLSYEILEQFEAFLTEHVKSDERVEPKT